METEANNLDHLVNYDNDNDIDDLGYESEVYLDEEEDENNHSNGNVVKRGITRLSKFQKEYGKPDGIKLSVTFNALNRISGKHRALFLSFLGDLVREHIGLKILSWKKVKSATTKMARSKSVYQHTMGRGGYAHVKEKMIENKEIEPNEEPPRGILWLKGRVNKDEEFPNDEIRSVGDKLKETKDKIKEGTLKVDHGTDAMTVVLGKETGGYARGVRSGVTYKRYFDLPRSRHASDERIVLLQSQLDNERRERQEKELEIQNLSNKMSQIEGMVTKLMNQLVAHGEQLKSMSTQVTPPDVSPVDINPIDSSADEEGETLVVGCENDARIQKSNGLATSEKEMETRVMDAACIPDVGNNSFKTVKDVVGGFFAWPKNQVVLDPKATPPSTIQMIDENKTAPKLQTKRKNVYVSCDAMQKQARKKSQKSLNY
ncbi:transposase, Ptta/En/Spm, transposase, Tnp1/En/Spm-like protein [Tanacetum coccineum]